MDDSAEIVFQALMAEADEIVREFIILSHGSYQQNREHGEMWLDHLRQLSARGSWLCEVANPMQSGCAMVSKYFAETSLYPVTMIAAEISEMISAAIEQAFR